MISNPHKPNLVRFLTYPFFPLNDVGLDWDAKGVIFCKKNQVVLTNLNVMTMKIL